ncbi:hypothetical protein [Clostridium boliviensis]|uniref:hypothetical protein n=1 Tax=Clostridium boliviensis TaxID=318465 RepID=UPI0029656E17|nr:hypothetical protein [Clostridium boliviensis]
MNQLTARKVEYADHRKVEEEIIRAEVKICELNRYRAFIQTKKQIIPPREWSALFIDCAWVPDAP